jgi:nucleosome binding factor SPN SPT16 subunit
MMFKSLFFRDDDMQSNFSHMSEAEEFSRMSELAEVSDEEDYDYSYDDIPEEASELDPSQDEDIEPWPEVNFEKTAEVASPVDQNATKAKSKPYVKLRIILGHFQRVHV